MKKFSQRHDTGRVRIRRDVAVSHAATTATWEMNTYQDFLKGRFEGLSLDRDGR